MTDAVDTMTGGALNITFIVPSSVFPIHLAFFLVFKFQLKSENVSQGNYTTLIHALPLFNASLAIVRFQYLKLKTKSFTHLNNPILNTWLCMIAYS